MSKNCNTTYKTYKYNSMASTKSYLIHTNVIDKYYNILDYNKFVKEHNNLNRKASELLKEKVVLYKIEDVGFRAGQRVFPVVNTFKKIDNAKMLKDSLSIQNSEALNSNQETRDTSELEIMKNINELNFSDKEFEYFYNKKYKGDLSFESFVTKAQNFIKLAKASFTSGEIIDKLNCL